MARGRIKLNTNTPLPQRLVYLHAQVTELLEKYEPRLAGIESPFFHKHASAVIQVSRANGVISMACAARGVAILDLPPSSVKNAIGLKGNANKTQMQEAIQLRYAMDTLPTPDEADAVAVAIAAVAHSNAPPAPPHTPASKPPRPPTPGKPPRKGSTPSRSPAAPGTGRRSAR